MASGSATALLAFACSTAPSQSPLLAADESSRSKYLTVKLPIFWPSRIVLICSTRVFVCSVFVPCRGRLEYTWISEELAPFLFWQAAFVPPPPPLGAVVPVLQALNASAATATSAPTLESFIQSPPQAGAVRRPGRPRSVPQAPPVRVPGRRLRCPATLLAR